MQPKRKRVSVAVIGGGITGITAALYLAKTGRFRVILFEKKKELGGLSRSYQWKDIVWDRFYHVILSTDTHLLELIEELKISQKLFWKDTKSGFYGDGKLVPFSSALDFIRFPFLSIFQKFRMALGILYGVRLENKVKLQRLYVGQWLTKVFGRRLYEKFWGPLLRSKLGDAREKTPAIFIWDTIVRLYGARKGATKKEKMGHVCGGYNRILDAAEKRLSELDVKIIKNSAILAVNINENRPIINNISKDTNISIDQSVKIEVVTGKGRDVFEKVVLTIPCPEILSILPVDHEKPYWVQLKKVRYLSVVCTFLVLTRSLSPYYVINLLDRDIPFTGIIEATNIVDPDQIGGKHLIYLPKYIEGDSPIKSLSDDQIADLFVENLRRVFPDLKDREIVHRRIFRETHVQPLSELNALAYNLTAKTPIPGVYLLNTAMLANTTLNNNAVVTMARRVVKEIRRSLI